VLTTHDNHREVIDNLDKINKKNNAKSIATFDFSTLYTKIPHNKLIDVLSEFVDTTFNDTNRRWIQVGYRNAFFTQNKSTITFSADQVKQCLKFLIGNSYFRVGNSIFRQIIGIPMGSDPAPFFANLFLAHYEIKWIKEHSRNDFISVKKLYNTSRYIDDLITLNDGNVFANSHLNIYPPELILNRENDIPTAATFLDLDIKIMENKFVYSLYDKRNSFSFYIIRFPYISSNIPRKVFYSTILAEILRI
jgi:hypothetical protein